MESFIFASVIFITVAVNEYWSPVYRIIYRDIDPSWCFSGTHATRVVHVHTHIVNGDRRVARAGSILFLGRNGQLTVTNSSENECENFRDQAEFFARAAWTGHGSNGCAMKHARHPQSIAISKISPFADDDLHIHVCTYTLHHACTQCIRGLSV